MAGRRKLPRLHPPSSRLDPPAEVAPRSPRARAYRNHGAAYGRVLCGIQVASDDRAAFFQALTDLGYPFTHETRNTAYRILL